MKLTPDARSYARTVAAGKPHEEQIAKAFHDGILHERARSKNIARLASSNTTPEPVQTTLGGVSE
jgi:hypothetical protein